VAKPAEADLFGDVMLTWLKRDQAGNKSAAGVESRMRNHVLPKWRHQMKRRTEELKPPVRYAEMAKWDR
jgi:hypothetical protein